MKSWGLAIENPFEQMTGSDGSCLLADAPLADHVMTAWHPGVGTVLEKKITVPAKGLVQADFLFGAINGRRSAMKLKRIPSSVFRRSENRGYQADVGAPGIVRRKELHA